MVQFYFFFQYQLLPINGYKAWIPASTENLSSLKPKPWVSLASLEVTWPRSNPRNRLHVPGMTLARAELGFICSSPSGWRKGSERIGAKKHPKLNMKWMLWTWGPQSDPAHMSRHKTLPPEEYKKQQALSWLRGKYLIGVLFPELRG